MIDAKNGQSEKQWSWGANLFPAEVDRLEKREADRLLSRAAALSNRACPPGVRLQNGGNVEVVELGLEILQEGRGYPLTEGALRDSNRLQDAGRDVRTVARRPCRVRGQVLAHLDGVFRLTLWLTRDRAEAEDVVQETFAQALQSFHRFQTVSNARGVAAGHHAARARQPAAPQTPGAGRPGVDDIDRIPATELTDSGNGADAAARDII